MPSLTLDSVKAGLDYPILTPHRDVGHVVSKLPERVACTINRPAGKTGQSKV